MGKGVFAGRGDPRFPWLGADTFFEFPNAEGADDDGVVAVGANLSPGLLLSAYRQGIFPWFNEDDPIVWHSPDPRFVFFPKEIRASDSMRRLLRKGGFTLCLDRDFGSVIKACSEADRPGQRGSWITDDMVEAYCELHRLGYAHSAEAWLDGRLVGGLYGVSLGRVFFGESMFHWVDNASKAAFLALAYFLADKGFSLIDSQVKTNHTASLGGHEIRRAEYLQALRLGLASGADIVGSWAIAFPEFPAGPGWEGLLARGKLC